MNKFLQLFIFRQQVEIPITIDKSELQKRLSINHSGYFIKQLDENTYRIFRDGMTNRSMTGGKLFICSENGQRFIRVNIGSKPDYGFFIWIIFVCFSGIYSLARGNTGGWFFIAFGLIIHFTIVLFFAFRLNSLKKWLKTDILSNS